MDRLPHRWLAKNIGDVDWCESARVPDVNGVRVSGRAGKGKNEQLSEYTASVHPVAMCARFSCGFLERLGRVLCDGRACRL
jgi:hypothetical protein